MEATFWETVRGGLREAVGAANFRNWIEPMGLARIEEGVATLSAPTTFLGNYVLTNFGEEIRRQIARAGGAADRLGFEVAGPSAAPAAASAGAAVAGGEVAPRRAAASAEAPGAVDAPLNRGLTFDSFVVGKANALAHAAARRVAAGPATGFNPLFLHSSVGLGKTHLMQAIAWELRAARPETKVLYVTAEKFMYTFIQALQQRDVMSFKGLFRSVDVLMVDDIQFIAGKDSTQEEFFHTFNELVGMGRQVVLSADRSPGEIAKLDDRIASRLACGLVVDIHPADYELRLSILRAKSEARCDDLGIEMADGVTEFLAQRIPGNVRELEGALNRLFAHADLMSRPIDLELTQQALVDVLRASERKVSLEEIQRKVAEHYSIRLSDLIGPKRVRTIARPRQVAMYLAKTLTHRSLPEIGRSFGGRDHTTIMHGVRRIEELQQIDARIAEDVEHLRRLLEA
ncbi:chromosomal replication initiator protein DnaA [Hasllibacter halocynthiae]|uniref:Chromosomal replication initiator protein DnaA n=1 Tax=Hasllibacter halocynthiae TaxID=595589 RepID=A0A2T0X2R2_9RHOB|nr:chromosomal replication initiator protein DnaA [Hasllibacter halocynthiae]PRY93230.1 chromosomal replication initiator protein DnaA [Hasllibacter halocynthiae]